MKYKYLSYVIANEMPVYGAKASINISSVKSIQKGDHSNVYTFTIENHWATHVDAPNHFFQHGRKVSEYEADFWIFINPQIVTINAEPGQIISKTDFMSEINQNSDLLLLQSGWGLYREKALYSLQNPGLDPSVALWLRKEYPSIRAIGLDWVSLSSYTNRELGRDAHRAFLDPNREGHPILIIEDMCFVDNIENVKEIWVVPLRVDGIDSAPCTVIGAFDD